MPNAKLPSGVERVLDVRMNAIVDSTGKILGHSTNTEDV